MGAHQSRAHRLILPNEIISLVVAAIPKSERNDALRTARLVCRDWNGTFTAVLFRNVTFTLTDCGGPYEDEVYDLLALAELLETGPYLCSQISSLTIEDCLPHLGDEESSDGDYFPSEDSDDDDTVTTDDDETASEDDHTSSDDDQSSTEDSSSSVEGEDAWLDRQAHSSKGIEQTPKDIEGPSEADDELSDDDAMSVDLDDLLENAGESSSMIAGRSNSQSSFGMDEDGDDSMPLDDDKVAGSRVEEDVDVTGTDGSETEDEHGSNEGRDEQDEEQEEADEVEEEVEEEIEEEVEEESDGVEEESDGVDEQDSDEDEVPNQNVRLTLDSGIPIVRCTSDPALLRRILLYLPRLNHLHLHNILITRMVLRTEIHKDDRVPLRIRNLHITVPGFHDDELHRDQVAYLLKMILTVFDYVDSLHLIVGSEDCVYDEEHMPKDLYAAVEPIITFKIRSFTATRVRGVPLRMLALNSTFRSLEKLRWHDAQAQNANALLYASGATLRTLHLTLAEPHCEEDEEEPKPLDFSRCVMLNELTLVFNLYTHHPEREQPMSQHVNNTLRTLLRRVPTAPPIAKFELWIRLESDELQDDGEWKLSPTSMEMIEETLLDLVDADACWYIFVKYDLRAWYRAEGIESLEATRYDVEETEEELEALRGRYAKMCERVLLKRFERLYEGRLTTVEEVSLIDNEYEEEMEGFEPQ